MEQATIEDIKKIADEKRKTIQKKKEISPELKQKRLENLAKGRETRKQKLLEKKSNISENKIVEEQREPEQEAVVEPVKTKKQAVKKQIVKKQYKKVMVVEDDESDDDEDEEETEIEPVVYKKQSLTRQKSHNNLQAFKNIYESINNIKDLISSQKEVIENAVKPKPKKPRAAPKPKKVNKTLDLTVSDAEVEKIVSNNKTQPKVDAKLQAFLEAFKR